jgi:predicted acyl esterase
VTLFVMRENQWRFEEDWPVARTIPTQFYFTAAGPYGTWFGFKYDDYLVQPDQRTDEAESLTWRRTRK